MTTPVVTLKPYGEFEPDALGDRLHHLIYGPIGLEADPRIAGDFPYMIQSYRTPADAAARVRRLTRIAAESNNARGFLAVVRAGQVIGVVTFAQEKLTRRDGWWFLGNTVTLADGPLLACWLGRIEARPANSAHLLGDILRAAADLLATNDSLHGRPWTLVRDNRNDRGHVSGYLTDTSNGFGGFRVERTDEFQDVDGVTGVRKLFVGARRIETLRG